MLFYILFLGRSKSPINVGFGKDIATGACIQSRSDVIYATHCYKDPRL